MRSYTLVADSWVKEEFRGARFSDLRLTKRFQTIMRRLFAGAVKGNKFCRDEAFSKGMFRFLKNSKVTLNAILSPHVEATIQRLPQDSYILNIQDTSGLNYHKHDSKIDIGHIGSASTRPDSYGYWLHTSILTDSGGTPLGLSHQELWSRQQWHSEDKNTKKSRNRKIPIEAKESYRWLDGVDSCDAYKSATNSKIVHICDREGDIFELFQKCRDRDEAFIIRMKSDRRLEVDGEMLKISDALAEARTSLKKEVEIEGNSQRKAKAVTVSIKSISGILPPPASNRTAADAARLNEIPVTIVQVTSNQKIDGKKVSWILVTNLEIEDPIFLGQVADWYALRWRIEIFFKALKSGANVESLRVTDLEKLSKYVLMLSLKAFRVLQLTYFSRANPEESITKVLTNLEWKVLKRILYPGRGRPNQKAGHVIQLIAQQGGFQKGKNRHPGIQTIWEGWARLSILISGAQALGVT